MNEQLSLIPPGAERDLAWWRNECLHLGYKLGDLSHQNAHLSYEHGKLLDLLIEIHAVEPELPLPLQLRLDQVYLGAQLRQ